MAVWVVTFVMLFLVRGYAWYLTDEKEFPTEELTPFWQRARAWYNQTPE